METTLIIIIVGLASAYLVRNFYRNLRKKDAAQCGCCTSCPKEENCNEPPTHTIHHIN